MQKFFMKFPSLDEIDQIRKTGYRPQIVGCFLNNKKILFLYDKKYNLWQLPQGGIKNHESIEEAVKREMTEELGERFATSMKIGSIIEQAQLEFPGKIKNSRHLESDAGEKIFMQGKKYFFVAIKTDSAEININETEFDDFKWLEFKEALELAKTIYQKGKQKITTDALESLRNSDLL